MRNLGLYPSFMLHFGLGGSLNTVGGMAKITTLPYQKAKSNLVSNFAFANYNQC